MSIAIVCRGSIEEINNLLVMRVSLSPYDCVEPITLSNMRYRWSCPDASSPADDVDMAGLVVAP